MGETQLRWLRSSLLVQAALAFYFQIIQWLPLGRWNYQPEHIGANPLSNLPLLSLAQEGRLNAGDVLLVLAFLAPFLSFCVGYLMNLRWFMWLQVVPYSIWFLVEMSWWVMYAVGYTDAQADRYRRVFSQATQLLPAIGRHLPPDGVHLVLHVLVALALASVILGLKKTQRATAQLAESRRTTG